MPTIIISAIIKLMKLFSDKKYRKYIITILISIVMIFVIIVYYLIFFPYIILDGAKQEVIDFFVDLFSYITGAGASSGAFFPIPHEFISDYSNDYGNPRNRPSGKGVHQGTDIFTIPEKEGIPIVACKAGTIEKIGWNQSGGWRIGIRTDDNNEYWFYAHMREEKPYAKGILKGVKVKAGQVIGYMGSSGYSQELDGIPDEIMPPYDIVDEKFAIHLHLGIYINDRAVNPYPILKELEEKKRYVTIKKVGEEYIFDSIYGSSNTKEFVTKMKSEVSGVYENTGFFESVAIAQASLESGWGTSELAIVANNLFGIKASSEWTGSIVTMTTSEYIDGNWIYPYEEFRAYGSWKESVEDHIKFLKQNNRYNKVFTAKNYKEQATVLQQAGYATDPNYAVKLIKIIEEQGLE